MNWFAKFERSLNRARLPRIMNVIIGGMVFVLLATLLNPSFNLYGWLYLLRGYVFQGQVWRLVTFIFLPPPTSLLFMVFALYFYWMIGNGLEAQWGTARFLLFYLTGMLGAILSALITGQADNTYLNLSLFLAFASIYPDFQVLVFFILPVKMKYLALANLALFLFQFIFGGWDARVTILFALLNVALFLGGDMLNTLRKESMYWKTRRNFRKVMRRR